MRPNPRAHSERASRCASLNLIVALSVRIAFMVGSHARVQLYIQRAHSHSRACKRYARVNVNAANRASVGFLAKFKG